MKGGQLSVAQNSAFFWIGSLIGTVFASVQHEERAVAVTKLVIAMAAANIMISST